MLLVTRPREQALQWVARLRQLGVPAAALPLLGIGPAPDSAAVERARTSLTAGGAALFVSPNAVEAVLGSFLRTGPAWPRGCLAIAPGPGTAAALAAHGVPADCIVQPAADSVQFDSEALWPTLQAMPWEGRPVVVFRGEDGRDWLIERLAQAGARVELVAAYRRVAPVLSGAEQSLLEQAFREPGAFVWLFSSSQAVPQMQALLSRRGDLLRLEPQLAAQARALATHPRILDRALELGWARLEVCRADPESVADSYNRIQRGT